MEGAELGANYQRQKFVFLMHFATFDMKKMLQATPI
jgi:hypothetical protein